MSNLSRAGPKKAPGHSPQRKTEDTAADKEGAVPRAAGAEGQNNETADHPAARDKSKKEASGLKREWLGLLIKAAVFIAVIAVVFTQVLMLKRVSGNAMFPFLKDGDLSLIVRHPGTLESGDVVVYEADGALHFGRILTAGAAEVNIDGNGAAYVNGIQESGENVLFPTNDAGTISYPCEVPEGSYFILNDMRDEVSDSRTYGAVTRAQIKGRVASFLRRRGV